MSPHNSDSRFNPEMEIQIIYQPDKHHWVFLSTRKRGSYEVRNA